MKIAAVVAVLLLGCGASSSTTPPPSNAPPVVAPADAAAAPATVDCDDVCTTYAVCSEEHYGGDFRGGGECVSSCEEMAEAARATWAKEIEDASASNDCKRLFVNDEE